MSEETYDELKNQLSEALREKFDMERKLVKACEDSQKWWERCQDQMARVKELEQEK